MTTFNEDQEFLKKLATNLILFAHQRETAYNLANGNGKIDFANEKETAIISVYHALMIDTEKFSEKIQKQLTTAVSICQDPKRWKGNDTNAQSFQSVTETLHRHCKECGLPIDSKSPRALFCSSRCRLNNFRSTINS